MAFSLDPNYIDVPTRIAEFRAKHPLGSFQQRGYELLEVGEKTYLAYTAAAYRTPDDERPGIGTAWEPVPGTTPYTKDSEMQNAETAAWGRAIVAALAADTNRGIASAEEVRNRSQQATSAPSAPPEQSPGLSIARTRVEHLAHQMKPELNESERIRWVVAALAARGLSAETAADLEKLADEWEGNS